MIRIGSWFYVGVIVCAAASTAHAQLALKPQVRPISQITPVVRHGELHGIVQDERAQPVAGAVVSAVGSTSAFAVSDREGRFTFRNLAPGPYLVRAHLQEYLPARGHVVQVSPDARNATTIALTKRSEAADQPTVLAAAGAEPAAETPAPPVEIEHGHDEVAWRLRHLKRSVLKDGQQAVADLRDDDSLLGDSLAGIGRAFGNSARLASSLFEDLSVSGQFNLITTTSFDRPQDLFSSNAGVPRSVAYVALEAPGARGDWMMRGSITQGDLASWILAGSYVRHAQAVHSYEAGVSYAMQRYMGGNADALAAIRDGSRNVGALYAFDSWTIAPRIRVGYGAKYARYDYLADRGLWSPRASVTIQPNPRDSFKLRATVSHREVAPGAEEFLPPSMGPWLPPQRTFAHVSHDAFTPERHDQLEVAVERKWPGDVVIGVRAFRQRVEDQVVTLFGVAVADIPAGIGHYQVGSAGDFDARGWGVNISRTMNEHLRASVDYTQADASWRRTSPDHEALTSLASSVLRSDDRVHDLTASVESLVSPTSTRIFVVYKLSAAIDASNVVAPLSSANARFDVQVNQALPFLNFTNAQWEMLVAVSNLFKEDLADASVYDELLVVRPPKRVLGGVTVRF
ncbi:MAG TPA: TonB-dependent receptor [Vicinamibacterales bacterium]|nr:TonB-dependent receptor [Vicinamibacterales bacterium]